MAGLVKARVTGGTFAFIRERPLFRTDDGSVTFEDTGVPWSENPKHAVGRETVVAQFGDVVEVTVEQFDNGAAHGMLEAVEPAKGKPRRKQAGKD